MLQRRGIAAFTLSAGAIAWSALLVVAAFTVDVYRGTSQINDGQATEFGSTLVEVNGAGAAVAMAIPLLFSVVTFFLLRRVCTTGSRWAAGVAGMLAWTLVAIAVITGFSVGMFVAPAAVALALAVSATPRPV